MSDSIVIIPTYNEIENIESIIRAVMALEQSFNIHNYQVFERELIQTVQEKNKQFLSFLNSNK